MNHHDREGIGPHACRSCYCINGEYEKVSSSWINCEECGSGVVLSLEELVDTLAERDSEIRTLKEIVELEANRYEDEEEDDDED